MRWSEKLLSGEYEQGEIALWDLENNVHCCLGVLCDIHPDVKWQIVGKSAVAYYGGSSSSAALPETTAIETGLSNKLKWWESTILNQMGIAVHTKTERETALQLMNDSKKFNFKQIAGLIMLLGWDVEISEE